MSLLKQWKKAFVELLKSPTITSKDGLILRLEYKNEENKLHRNPEISPAVISYYKNSNISYESYWVNGEIHRLGGPAIIEYYENGNIHYEEYWVNDEKHRLDGPAIIRYFENGNMHHEEYWINGKKKIIKI